MPKYSMVTLFSISCALLGGGGRASAEPTLDEVLAHVRDATGINHLGEYPNGIRLTGEGQFLGQKARTEALFNSQGHFLTSWYGPVSMTEGFDGTVAWVSDIGREQRIAVLGDRANLVLSGGIPTHYWFKAGAPIVYELAPEQQGSDALRLKYSFDEDRVHGTVVISKTDWLPTQWTIETGASTETISLSGSQKFGPLTYPTSVHLTSSAGSENQADIQQIGEAPTFIRSPYQYVPAAASDSVFDINGGTIEVKKAPTGHLLVRPKVNGRDVGWFIFDSGAGITVLDTKTSDDLQLKHTGDIVAMGVGGPTKASIASVESFSLGALTIKDQIVMDLNLSFLSQRMGTPIAGIVGYPVFARSVVTVDMSGPRIDIADPARFQLSSGGWNTLYVAGRHPCVEGEFENHRAVFRLDTGASDTVTFHAWAVNQWHLLDQRETKDTMMGGVGGMIAAKSGEVAWFELGGVRRDAMRATFATQEKGAFADRYIAGNVGSGFLKDITLIMDYPNNRISFVPKSAK